MWAPFLKFWRRGTIAWNCEPNSAFSSKLFFFRAFYHNLKKIRRAAFASQFSRRVRWYGESKREGRGKEKRGWPSAELHHLPSCLTLFVLNSSLLYNPYFGNLRDRSDHQNTYSSWWGSEFASKNPHGSSQLSVNFNSKESYDLFWPLQAPHTCGAWVCMQAKYLYTPTD